MNCSKQGRKNVLRNWFQIAKHEPDPAADNVLPVFPEKVCLSLFAGISQYHILY
jgi:hypothetical protein